MVHQRSVAGVFYRRCQGPSRAPRWREDGARWRVRFLHVHSTSVFRNVKVILAVNQVPADSDTVLSVLMVTAVKTAR